MTTLDEEQELLRAAAGQTLKRIERDRDSASVRIKQLLTLLEEHLFEQEFGVDSWLAGCGQNGSLAGILFHAEVGLTPASYIWDCRLETSFRLLRDTRLSVNQIGELVGYSGRQAFSKAFERWSGLRPTPFRNIDKRYLQSADMYFSTPFLRRVDTKSLDPVEDKRLRQHFQLLNPGLEDELASHNSRTCKKSNEELDEQRLASRIWNIIKDLRFTEQRAIVRCQIGFETTALFDLLRERSRQEGRIDGARGVSLAKLALMSLEACEDFLGDDLHNRQAQGWIWLGNAQRLDFSFLKAEQSFVVAEAKLRLASESHDPLVAAELNYYKAALRWYQRQYEDASDLAERATALFRELDHRSYLAQSLILESGIQRQRSSCAPEPDQLSEALNLIDARTEPYLLATCYSHLAVAHIRQERFDAATRAVSRVKEICQDMNYQRGLCRSLWLEGQVFFGRGDNDSARDCYERACAGFENQGEVFDIAAVKLDLAILHEKQGHGSKVLKLAAEALPVFDTLKIRREACAAIRLLRRGIETNQITMAILLKARLFFEDVALRTVVA